ncbi:MAG: recombinase family protein [Victivallaceae bacterium]|nr:recombinase family protein [Victivallaceae bacterium]
MLEEIHKKIKASHLKRNAYLYIRQSTLKQVMRNQESTRRQYALKDRAIASGWLRNQITVIDCDQGKSGAEGDRKGFQKLVADVGMGRAGIVMGLEVSRLARNSTDWHRLIEICALSDTLILDEDGVYNPAHFNDRLLLGLKGTMSEAELHILRARLRGGILNKAKRGELKRPIPIGFVYDQNNRVVLDPNKMVQDSINLLFKTFNETDSAYLTVKKFREKGLTFPRRPCTGPNKGEVIFGELNHDRVLKTLHNPRYAGVFYYGRNPEFTPGNETETIIKFSKDRWLVYLSEAHQGYISEEQFEQNQKQLLENAGAYGIDRKKRPPREGNALIQGIVICGICGRRMSVAYHNYTKGLCPEYTCTKAGIENAQKTCQHIPGDKIDKAIGDILVGMMTPATLELALSVQKELENQTSEVDQLHKKHLQQLEYEANLARRRYMNVDPENRLVADSLEADWNENLRAMDDAKNEYRKKREKESMRLRKKQREQIMALTTDFPKLWNAPDTPNRERKRMLRLLLEDVTLIKDKEITVNIRFKGGATKTLHLPLPQDGFTAKKTKPEVIKELDHLLDKYSDSEIVSIFTKRGMKTETGLKYGLRTLMRIRMTYGLKDRRTRLIEQGMLTRKEMLKLLNTNDEKLKGWKDTGMLKIHHYSIGQHFLFEPPGKAFFDKIKEAQSA